MAGVETVANTVRTDVHSQLQTLNLADNALWENTGQDPRAVGSGTFVRILVDFAQSPQVTRKYTRWDGAVIAECYDDLNRGPERVEAVAESILAALKRRRLLSSMLLYRRAEFFRVGVNEELGRWQGNARVEFTYYESEGDVVTNEALVDQDAHSLSAGDWVGYSSGYVLAGSNEAVGFVASVPNVNQFRLVTDGPVNIAHGNSDGPVYLHVTTDGASQSTEPGPGERFQRLGYAAGSTLLIVRIEPQESF